MLAFAKFPSHKTESTIIMPESAVDNWPPPTPRPSKWKEIATGIGGTLLGILILGGGFVLLALFFSGIGWIAEHVYPWTLFATQIAVFLIIPLSLLLLIPKRSRGVGGIGLFLSSYLMGLQLWVWSLLVAYATAGSFWLIVGVIFMGLGVIVVAFFASLLAGHWIVAGQILILVAVIYGLRGLGLRMLDQG